MDTIEIIELIATVTAAITIIVTCMIHIKQDRLSLFVEYTKRYQEIMLHFPSDCNLDFSKIPDEEKDEILRYMRAYLDLCSEELHLYKVHKISKRVWKEWASGIDSTLQNDFFRNCWNEIKAFFHDYEDFNKWINGIENRKMCKSEIDTTPSRCKKLY